jgi:hypothetical protein
MTCPSFDALSLAASDAAPEAVQAHVAACPRCRPVVDELLALRRLAQAIPASEPRPEHAQAREDALLRATRARTAARAQRRGLALGAAAGAMAASVAALALFQLRDPPGPSERQPGGLAASEVPRGAACSGPSGCPSVGQPGGLAASEVPRGAPALALALRPAPDARFERRVVQRGPALQEERVVLDSGALELEVPALAPGHRFHLESGAVRVEAAQARLTARAEGGRLLRLEVLAGQVELQETPGAPPLILTAGAVWSPTSTPAPTDQETAFADAWRAQQDGRSTEAAPLFDAAWTAAPRGPLAPDALYWSGALRTDSDPETAAARFERLLEDHPDDSRAPEAALWLAHRAEAEGELAQARRWAQRAAEAEDPELREAGQATLRRLSLRP